jgi:hypothetical protein
MGRRQPHEDVVELLFLVDQRLLGGFQVADRVLQQRPVVGQQIGDRAGCVADVGDRRGDRVGPVLQTGDQPLEVDQRVVELLLVLDGGLQHGVEVTDHLADGLITVGQRRRQRRGLVEDVVDGAALALEDGDDRLGDVVDLLWVECPEQRPEAADQGIEVECRFGAVDRDGAARGHPAVAVAALELEVAVADQVEVAHRCGRLVEQRKRTVDREVDLGPATALDQFDVGDLADLDTRRADELPGPQPADIAEDRRVAGGAIEAHLAEHHDDDRAAQQQHQ